MKKTDYIFEMYGKHYYYYFLEYDKNKYKHY